VQSDAAYDQGDVRRAGHLGDLQHADDAEERLATRSDVFGLRAGPKDVVFILRGSEQRHRQGALEEGGAGCHGISRDKLTGGNVSRARQLVDARSTSAWIYR
jgi:hypothetical protein